MDTEDRTPKRTKIACEECRKNKRKCDGQRPTCSLCQRGRRVCEYTSEPNGRKRKRYGAEYIRELEEQIDALTALVNRNGGSPDTWASSDAMSSDNFHVSSLDMAFDASYSNHVSGINEVARLPDQAGDPDSLDNRRRKSQDDFNQRSTLAMEDLGQLMLKMGIDDEGEPSFTIPTAGRNKPGAFSQKKGPQVAVVKPNTKADGQVLQDLELRRHLLDCFMRYFNPFHQVFVPKDVSKLEQEDYEQWTPDEELRNMAVFSIGAYFSDTTSSQDIGQQCAEHAENMILQCLKHHPSDLLVQGLSLLAWRDLSLGNDSMSWNYNSSATGLALRIGIHVTALVKPKESSAPPDLDLYRRRVRSFWVYFSIDRMVTSILGMNCTMPWQRVRVSPFSVLLDSSQSSVDGIAFCRQGQLWHLWDSLMDQTYAFDWPFLTTEGKNDLLLRSQNALVSFHQESNPILRGSAPSAIYYQLAFHTAMILIHRPFFSEPIGTPNLLTALEAATQAAVEICRILREAKKNSSFEVYPQHVVNYIVCAAVIHLMNATCGRTTLGRRAANNLKTCMRSLWDMSRRCTFRQQTAIRFIQEMAHKWKVVWALPIQFSAPLESENHSLRKDKEVACLNIHEAELERDFWQMGENEYLWDPDKFQGVADYFGSVHSSSELGWIFGGNV